MKRLYLLLILALPFTAMAQATYKPSQHNPSSAAYGPQNATPTDARSMFKDSVTQRYRDFASVSEALAYLNGVPTPATPNKYRFGHVPIFIHSGGALVNGQWVGGTMTPYWFRDCLTDECLVPMLISDLTASGLLSLFDSGGNILFDIYGDKLRPTLNFNFVVSNPGAIPNVAGQLITKQRGDSMYAPIGSAADGNNYIGQPSYNTGTGDLTIPRVGLSSVSVNILSGSAFLSSLPGYGAGKMLVATGSGFEWVDTISSAVALTTPAAPTGGTIDDIANTFNWINTSGYTSATDYEYRIGGSGSYTGVTAKPLSVGDVAISPGALELRVKAVPGVSNVSASLTNATAFTVAGTFTPLIVQQNNYGGSMLVAPSGSSSTIATSLMYRKNGGLPRPVLPGDTIDADYAVIPILDSAYGIGTIKVWDPAHPGDTASNTAAFTSLPVSGSTEATNITVVGDSHTSNGWQADLYAGLASSYTGKTASGYAGQTLNAFLSDTSQLNPALRRYVAGKRNIAIVEFGRNDASTGVPLVTQMANRRTVDSLFKDAGFDFVIHGTIPPSRWNGLTQPAAENLRRTVNDSLRRWASLDTNIRIFDFGGDPYIGNPDNTLNPLLYNTSAGDRTHLTTLGYTYASAQALSVVLSLPDVGSIALPAIGIGDTVEDDNPNLFVSGPPNPSAGSGAGYTQGHGLYFPASTIGYFELDFYGGGFEYLFVPGLDVQVDFVLDGDTLDKASVFVNIPSTTRWAVYGLPVGNHTLRVQSTPGAPGLTVWDWLKINDGQQFSTFLAPSTPIEENNSLWFYSGTAFGTSANVIYSAGQANYSSAANAIAQLPFSGSSIDIYTPASTQMEAWVDGVYVQTINSSVGFVNVPASGPGNHVLKLFAASGGTAIIDMVEAQP